MDLEGNVEIAAPRHGARVDEPSPNRPAGTIDRSAASRRCSRPHRLYRDSSRDRPRPHEQRVIAMLREGVRAESCDPVALLSLKRIAFIQGSRLTQEAEKMLSAALPLEFA